MEVEQAQNNMITQQLRTCNVLDERVLDVIKQTPRAFFVPPQFERLAYSDTLLPIGHGETMLLPVDEARILQALLVQANEKVLEVGTGSAYMTALLSKLAKEVHSVDIHSDFIENAEQALTRLRLSNVQLSVADYARGFDEGVAYDVIVITGSLPFLPQSFKDNLTIGGRLFAILGEGPAMQATLFVRETENIWDKTVLFETNIKALDNAEGFSRFEF